MQALSHQALLASIGDLGSATELQHVCLLSVSGNLRCRPCCAAVDHAGHWTGGCPHDVCCPTRRKRT